MSRAFVFLGEVEQGNLCAVASAMKKGANPNTTFIGVLPLKLCVEMANVDMACLLLDWGADPDKAASVGATSARQLAQRISENPTDKDRPAAVEILELMGNRERVRQRMREIETRIAAQAERERRALLKSVMWLFGYACTAYLVYRIFWSKFRHVGMLDQKEL